MCASRAEDLYRSSLERVHSVDFSVLVCPKSARRTERAIFHDPYARVFTYIRLGLRTTCSGDHHCEVNQIIRRGRLVIIVCVRCTRTKKRLYVFISLLNTVSQDVATCYSTPATASICCMKPEDETKSHNAQIARPSCFGDAHLTCHVK